MFEIEVPVRRFHTHQASLQMRGRRGTGGYMSAEGRGYKGLIRRDVRNAMSAAGVEAPLFAAPDALSLQVDFRYAGVRKQAQPLAYRVQRPDLDNMLKLVKDAMEGLLFEDDAQLGRVVMQKLHVAGAQGHAIKIRVARLDSAPEWW